MPAFVADYFGSTNVGSIYGLMLTAWDLQVLSAAPNRTSPRNGLCIPIHSPLAGAMAIRSGPKHLQIPRR